MNRRYIVAGRDISYCRNVIIFGINLQIMVFACDGSDVKLVLKT